jgi:hypothetical protein
MKHNRTTGPAEPATLQDVLDRLGTNTALSESRRRDLRSAIVVYAKVVGEAPAAIPLDLASIRKTLDGVVPLQAKVSRKRWANLRSDIAGAIAASGLGSNSTRIGQGSSMPPTTRPLPMAFPG